MGLEDYDVDARLIHTPGSISVGVQDKTIIAEDLLAGGNIIGGIEKHSRPTIPPFQEDIVESKKSIEKVLALNPDTIHVCHSGPLNVPLVRKMVKEFDWSKSRKHLK